MYRERVIAWGCGIAAFLLILMAGKGCMGTPQASNKNSANTTTEASTAPEYNIIKPDIQQITEPPIVGYDIFGKPIYATEPPTTETTVNAEGEVSTDTTVTAVSDTEPTFPEETTAEGETTENPTAETSSEADTSEPPAIPPGFDGNDHRVYDDEGNERATIPPDFVIIIE